MKNIIVFKDWYNLFIKFKNLSMHDVNNREAFEQAFTKLSARYWAMILINLNSTEVAQQLSSIWFNCSESYKDIHSPVEAYTLALERLEYSSDRMTFNRWFHIRWLLNLNSY